MQITYDAVANAAYIYIAEKKKGELETRVLSDSVNIDLNEDGSVFGIELLNANEQLRSSSDGAIVLVEQNTGHEVRLRLAGKPAHEPA